MMLSKQFHSIGEEIWHIIDDIKVSKWWGNRFWQLCNVSGFCLRFCFLSAEWDVFGQAGWSAKSCVKDFIDLNVVYFKMTCNMDLDVYVGMQVTWEIKIERRKEEIEKPQSQVCMIAMTAIRNCMLVAAKHTSHVIKKNKQPISRHTHGLRTFLSHVGHKDVPTPFPVGRPMMTPLPIYSARLRRLNESVPLS